MAGRVGPLSEVAAWAAHLPPESAVRRAMDPHWQRTPEVDLLRENAYLLDVLVYVTATGNGAKNLPMPERIPLPWDPAPDDLIQGDVMTLDELDAWLGWDKLKEA